MICRELGGNHMADETYSAAFEVKITDPQAGPYQFRFKKGDIVKKTVDGPDSVGEIINGFYMGAQDDSVIIYTIKRLKDGLLYEAVEWSLIDFTI
jgi:hypothetical protein